MKLYVSTQLKFNNNYIHLHWHKLINADTEAGCVNL